MKFPKILCIPPNSSPPEVPGGLGSFWVGRIEGIGFKTCASFADYHGCPVPQVGDRPGRALGGTMLLSAALRAESASRDMGEAGMKRLLTLGLLLSATVFSTGCFLNRYSSEPRERMMQLLNESEDLRQINQEKMRWWMNNQPSTLSYDRLNGAIGP